MSAPLALAAPAAGASAAKAGTAKAGPAKTDAADSFGGTLYTVLAAAPAPAAPVAAAAVQAQDGPAPPGLVSEAGELRKAEDPDGENQDEVLLTGSPATIPGTTTPGLAAGAAPGTASPAPTTPAAAAGTVQAAPAGARVEASVNGPAATDPAGDTAHLAGTSTPTVASAVAPAAAPVIIPASVPVAAAPAAAPSGPAPSAVPAAQAAPAPPGFAAQLARPVFTWASGAAGGHTMTVAVNPESLGPVTVQAHISASGVRVELFAASADGREALRQILPDLKRDLAGAGLNAYLELSAGNQPGGGQDGREQFFHGRAATAYPGETGEAGSRQPAMNNQASRATAGLHGTDGSLDVMA